MTEYKITRDQCREKIFGVCSGCGGPLEPIETVDNARDPTFWPGCLSCSRFDYGVPERVFKAARKLVSERWLKPYKHIPDDAPYYTEEQTRGATSIVLDVLSVLREIDSDGSGQ